MTEYMHTGAVMLLISLVSWLLHRSLARISGQIAAVADSLGRHIADDKKQHDAGDLAVRQLWQAMSARKP